MTRAAPSARHQGTDLGAPARGAGTTGRARASPRPSSGATVPADGPPRGKSPAVGPGHRSCGAAGLVLNVVAASIASETNALHRSPSQLVTACPLAGPPDGQFRRRVRHPAAARL